MLLNYGIGKDPWVSLRLQGDPTSPYWRKSVLNIHWKDWCWSWNLSTLATWCEELTHWKRPQCWERLKVRGEGDERGWGGWMASPIQWTWVLANFGSWWWTEKPGALQSMTLQRFGHDWVTELNWKQNQHPVVDMTGVESKPDTVNNRISLESGILGPLIKVNWKLSNRRWQEWTSTF